MQILRTPRVKDRRLSLNLEKIRISIKDKSGYYRRYDQVQTERQRRNPDPAEP